MMQKTDEPVDRAAAIDVPVTTVVLYSSGVGYFEHSGPVSGSATSELRFKAEQINDVLKSLVLQDAGGRVGTVVYPSQDPLDKTLRSFQVDVTDNPSLDELLNQLRGARVAVVLPTETVAGTIIGCEQRKRAVVEKTVVDVWLLNLLVGGSIRTLALDDVQRLDIEDPTLQAELVKALAALAAARGQDKKPVTIQFEGDGERAVRIGYVVEAPVWKTSYRLLLPAEAAKDIPPRLQGWAILENQTDNDWKAVRLTLVSGRPISFVQELYRSLYVTRPVVQQELYESLTPQMYEGGMSLGAAAGGAAPAAPMAASMAAPQPFGMVRRARMAKSAAAPEQLADATIDEFASDRSVAAAASTERVGELFQYVVPDVSLPRQRSAMIPIVTDDIEVERLSIYNRATLPRHPLTGARLKNTTGKHLLQGPVTVLEGSSYAGDARIENLPPGQERLISFGIDLQVLINSTQREDATIETGSIAKGVLRVSNRRTIVRRYAVENKSDRDKTLIIEHPIAAGYTLSDTPAPAETTDQLYRFRVPLKAGAQATVEVKEQQRGRSDVALTNVAEPQLRVYVSGGRFPKAVADALADLASRRSRLDDAQRAVEEREQQLEAIVTEQARIRENLSSAPEKSQYQTRLLNKLNEQETRIESIQADVERLRKAHEQQQAELETYMAGLSIGGDD